VPLKDALGSTVALVDSSGAIQTTYSYDPFGNTTISGAINANAFQYTGRENEGNGLYFYRKRYYSAVLHRFISQDPLRFAGSGSNFYAYAGNAQVNFIDPFGLEKENTCISSPPEVQPGKGGGVGLITGVTGAGGLGFGAAGTGSVGHGIFWGGGGGPRYGSFGTAGGFAGVANHGYAFPGHPHTGSGSNGIGCIWWIGYRRLRY
jgi:RHS repeat-associated protein